jgi:hypothetical protein
VIVDIVPCVESQENEDSKARKSQVDRERYEKLSWEKKGERNRKGCERRLKTKALAIGKKLRQLHFLMTNQCASDGRFFMICVI